MSDKLDLRRIATEQRNPRTAHIDELPTIDMVRLINSEDKKVAEAVELVCPQIAEAIDLIYSRLRDGGRLVYCGCGTSGRLGVLDAVECPPTYSVDPDFVRGIIAGGYSAVFKAVEGAEDKRELGERSAGRRLRRERRARRHRGQRPHAVRARRDGVCEIHRRGGHRPDLLPQPRRSTASPTSASHRLRGRKS